MWRCPLANSLASGSRGQGLAAYAFQVIDADADGWATLGPSAPEPNRPGTKFRFCLFDTKPPFFFFFFQFSGGSERLGEEILSLSKAVLLSFCLKGSTESAR